MKGILEEMMSLFPDKYFHLGLDEVITTTVCTMESELNAYFINNIIFINNLQVWVIDQA